MAKKRTSTKQVQELEDKPFIPIIDAMVEVDNAPWDKDGLTVRQRSFVEALVGPAGGQQTVAAEMAGYAAENRNSLRVTAHDLLTQPNVQRAVALALAARRMTPEWAKARLADIASADMANFVTIDENGKPKVDFKKAEAIGAIGQIKEYDPESGKLKLHDPAPALITILKMYGLITEKHEHTGKDGGPIETRDADLRRLSVDDLRIYRELLAKAAGGTGPN